MFLVLIVGLLVSALIWMYICWSRVRNYWAERGVPHIPPHPIYGNLGFIQRINASSWMKNFYKKFDTPYAGMWLLWRPTLVVNDPSIAKRILVKDFELFRNRYLGSGQSDPVGNLNLFTANDPKWTKNRRKLTSLFTASRMRDHHVVKNKKIGQLMTRMKNEILQGNKIELRTILSDFSTDIISYAIFGIECDATSTGDSPIRTITRQFMNFNIFRGLAWSSIFYYPDFIDIFRFEMFPKKSSDYMKRLYRELKSQRQEQEAINVNESAKYLVDSLMKREKEAEAEGKEVEEDELIAEIAIFIQGGFDTSALGTMFTMVELAYSQETQEKLYQELFEAKEKLGTIDFDTKTLAELRYLNCVLKETFRKYPSIGWLDRIASTDYKIDDKLTIKAKTPVFVNIIGMHYDPITFPDPEKFMPERFLPENERNIPPFTYMPFGDGPRSCIGKNLGIGNVLVMVARLVLTFKMEPYPDTPHPKNFHWEPRVPMYIPSHSLFLRLTPRD